MKSLRKALFLGEQEPSKQAQKTHDMFVGKFCEPCLVELRDTMFAMFVSLHSFHSGKNFRQFLLHQSSSKSPTADVSRFSPLGIDKSINQ